MSDKLLISLFDHTGNASRPFEEMGWTVMRVDIQEGIDILEWDFVAWFNNLCTNQFPHAMPEVGIIAMIPCDAYALCGNKHKKTAARKELFAHSQKLVAATKRIIDWFDNVGILLFWVVENPMSDIHKHNPWLGKITQQIDPTDCAGYDPVPDNSRYNKKTWLWGKFKKIIPKRMEPLTKDNPGWKNLGGKSLKTKNARSVTPLGLSYGFAEANI